MSNIKCSVESCTYNGAGKVCTAKAIEVNANDETCLGSLDMEVAELGVSSQVDTSSQTMCKTFKKKE